MLNKILRKIVLLIHYIHLEATRQQSFTHPTNLTAEGKKKLSPDRPMYSKKEKQKRLDNSKHIYVYRFI